MSAANSSRPLNRLSLKFSMVEEPGLSLIDRFRLIADLGFDGVELDSPSELSPDEVLKARDATGLAIPGLINSRHWKAPLTHPDAEIRAQCVAAMRHALEEAQAYGATTVLLVPGVVNAETSYREAYDRAIEGIGALLPDAERTGVAIALENVWNDFLLSPLEAARLVDHFNHPLVGWYFDVGNVLRYGRPAHWIEALGPRILKIDVKEFSLDRMNSEGPWKGFGVELGEGDCDWPTVNRALAAAGYSGWASLEVPGGNRDHLAALKSRLDRIVAA